MSYKEQLSTISEVIFKFDKDLSRELDDIVEKSDIEKIRIYRKNLFFLVYERISEEFPSVNLYLSKNNFRFLVRKYLLENRIESSSITDYSLGFSAFLEKKLTFHNDKLLYPLSVLDTLYNHAATESLILAKGTFNCWRQVIQGQEVDSLDIDYKQKEIVFCEELNGERYLKVDAVDENS